MFPEYLLRTEQHDALAELGEMAKTPEANIIAAEHQRLSRSSSRPLRNRRARDTSCRIILRTGRTTKKRTSKPATTKSKAKRGQSGAARGQPDRRAPLSVKAYAGSTRIRCPLEPDSKTHVSHMKGGISVSNEKSMTIPAATTAKIEFVGADGKTTVLKEKIALQAGEVLDATFMSVKALRTFLEQQIEEAKKQGVLWSST